LKRSLVGMLGLSLIASSVLADVEINLDPIVEDFVGGKRIVLNAVVDDKAGLDVIRTYFKSADAANYSFVPMTCQASECMGTLPAPSASTKAINYLVLVKNKENKVYKTQTFKAMSLPKGSELPDYQKDLNDSIIKVKTELAKAPEMVTGFTDNVVIDTVQDTVRYGLVAGITGSGSSASAAGAASLTGTTSAGTVAAGAAGLSTTAMVVGGVVAVGAGAGVASSGGSSDSSSTEECVDLTGTWNTKEWNEYCGSSIVATGTETHTYANGHYSWTSSSQYIDSNCDIIPSEVSSGDEPDSNKCLTRSEAEALYEDDTITHFETNKITAEEPWYDNNQYTEYWEMTR